MKILGISAFYHDSAAALVVDGKIVAAAQEERFSRKKHDAGFPLNAAMYCLHEQAIQIDDLDAVVFYDKPLLKFERLLETYYGFAPRGIASFVTAIPVWIKEKIFLKKIIRDELKKIGSYNRQKLKLLFPEHHLSHAASTFFTSPYEEAAILTIDGVGEWATASMGHGKGTEIKNMREMHFPHSVGLLYSSFTHFLGFRVNSGEYKLMGLAPYGNPTGERVSTYVDRIRKELVRIHDDGSVWLNQSYFCYATGLRMIREKKWKQLFDVKRREPEAEIEQCHADLALAIQLVTEEIVLKMARELKKITGSENICIAGGVALNCVANGKLAEEGIFKKIYIQPAAGDAGGAVGAALAAYHMFYGNPRKVAGGDLMEGSYLGPSFSDKEIEHAAKSFNAVFRVVHDTETLTKEIAEKIADGKVIGWFQGRMEFGPRALGSRSILGDARNRDMQKKLNLKIKYRESFRPFAPSVLEEDMREYFFLKDPSPYMLMVSQVNETHRKPLPGDYYEKPIRERLYIERSDIPAVTHIDMSARIQTVSKATSPLYWELINAFKKLTGYGLLLNTSFNVRGEPIVCSPEDAYRCFMRTEMDLLVMGKFIFKKEEQPEQERMEEWKEEYLLD